MAPFGAPSNLAPAEQMLTGMPPDATVASVVTKKCGLETKTKAKTRQAEVRVASHDKLEVQQPDCQAIHVKSAAIIH